MRSLIMAMALSVSACSTVDNRRIVEVSDPDGGALNQVHYLAPEAQAACETRKMRRRALDGNLHNDVAPVTVMREVGEGVRMLTDLNIDCREYFVSRLRSEDLPPLYRQDQVAGSAPLAPTVLGPEDVHTTPTYQNVDYIQPPHRIEIGETLSGLAQQYCVSLDALATHNRLNRTTRIKAGDTLTIPAGSC